MDKLVFIDDDERELDEFRRLIEGNYTYTLVHWPSEREKLFSGPPPDVFVSDLYLPSADGDRQPTAQQREQGASMAREIADCFQNLYPTDSQGAESIETWKARLQATMKLITKAYPGPVS
jgi:hypothetical protein